MTESNQSSINYHSPKNEIWTAYKELQKQLEAQKSGPTVVQEGLPMAAKTQVDWRQQLLKAVKQLDAQVQEKEEELSFLQDKIAKAKEELENTYQIKVKAQTFNELGEKINSLENLQQRRQKQLEEEYKQEKSWREKRLEKEEEEKKFELELKRRQLEQELDQKQRDWEKKEQHYQELQQETAGFPERLQKVEEKAGKETAACLEREFAQEKAMLSQKHESDQKLSGQQIKNLQEKVKEQEQQIKALGAQLSDAHQRIKELAVAALESKRPREEKPSPQN